MLEILRPVPAETSFLGAVFDFDGTINLLTEGWQGVMLDLFCETLLEKTNVEETEFPKIRQTFSDMIFELTGKPSIYQCIAAAEEMKRRGGENVSPDALLDSYARRLDERTQKREASLRGSTVLPERFMVPGARRLLEMLAFDGLKILLVSGTKISIVQPQCELLQISSFFNGGIFGAPEDSRNFSKETVIREFLEKNGIPPESLVGFGDGFVETKFVHEIGGYAVGLATKESERDGNVNEWKRKRLLEAGADAVIPDFANAEELVKLLGIRL